MLQITLAQYDLVYNAFSFTIAVMGAATLFFILSRSQVAPAYRTALAVTALVTGIALYHCVRIASSWESAYAVVDGTISATGVKFNDAYRYVDWLLTVSLLLVELILVMRLSPSEFARKPVKLGALAALMVALGYPGEIAADSSTRWLWWSLSMIPFLIIVYDLSVGLKTAIVAQPEAARGLIKSARTLDHRVVVLLPRGIRVANAGRDRRKRHDRRASGLHDRGYRCQGWLRRADLPDRGTKVATRRVRSGVTQRNGDELVGASESVASGMTIDRRRRQSRGGGGCS